MTPPTIELVRVSGTHREVGLHLGEAGREQIRRTVETSWDELPSGRSKADQLALADEYRAFTAPPLPWLSVGWNAAGLSLTGNELSPNDERVGISRSHQVLEMMRARSLDQMVAMALRTDRASSYNNVLTSAAGGVANVEGSATDAEVTGLDARGHLAHTNNYVCDRMLPFEGDTEYAPLSRIRYERARELLAAEPPASLTMDRLRELLSDHETRPPSLCKHPEFGTPRSKTVFWCVADVTDG